jgi:hypothetical protein
MTSELPSIPRRLTSVPIAPVDNHADAHDRHPSSALSLSRSLDGYLSDVAEALQARGVTTGPPQRSDATTHLTASIVVDCTALSTAPSTAPLGNPAPTRPATLPPGAGALPHDRPTPTVVAWDEDHGWAVGLQHTRGHTTRRYPHPDSLPTPDEIAAFVVDLAGDQVPDATDPEATDRSGTPRLRLVT